MTLPVVRLPTEAGLLSQTASTDIESQLKAALKSLPTLAVSFQKSSIWKDDEFMGVREIPRVESGDLGEAKEILRFLELTSQPASGAFISQEIYRLTLTTAKRSDSDADFSMQVGAYIVDLADFPEDAVLWACAQARRSKKFFPTVNELRELCEERMEFRCRLRTVLKQAQTSPPKLESKPRPDRHDIPKSKWDKWHWQEYVEDAARMVALAEQNPSLMNAEEWRAILEQRRQEGFQALAGMEITPNPTEAGHDRSETQC